MQFISLQENLKKGLNIVSHTTSKNINLPILNNILIKASPGEIELIGTNLEIGINCKISGKVEEDGDFTVNSKLLTEYVNLLSSGDKVLFKLNDNQLSVESENYKIKIKGEEAKEFPLIPTIEGGNNFSLAIDVFRKALSKVIFSVSNSENRLELTGVLFSFSDSGLELAATDSYRLAEKKIIIKTEQEDFKIIVPAKTVQELLRILNSLSDDDIAENINIAFSDNQILFVFANTSLISRLINGNYPDYKQIIPNNEKTKALVNKNELLRAVKASSLFSKNGINDILLQFRKNQIVVSSFSNLSGESKIKLGAEITGENENEITINYKYLVDGLNNVESERVEIAVLNNNTPCSIREENKDDYLYIIMPIKQ